MLIQGLCRAAQALFFICSDCVNSIYVRLKRNHQFVKFVFTLSYVYVWLAAPQDASPSFLFLALSPRHRRTQKWRNVRQELAHGHAEPFGCTYRRIDSCCCRFGCRECPEPYLYQWPSRRSRQLPWSGSRFGSCSAQCLYWSQGQC